MRFSLPCPTILLFFVVVTASTVAADVRPWKDSSGRFSVNANLVTADENLVVLEEHDGKLVVLQRSQLSTQDQEYLAKTLAVKESADVSADRRIIAMSTWHLRDGSIVKGRLIGFGSQSLVVQRKRGKIQVNDKDIESLPAAYEKILPNVVSAVDGEPLETLQDVEQHLTKGGGGPFTYLVEGIQLNLNEGGAITIPLALLAVQDAEQVAPNFARWQAATAEGVSKEDRSTTEQRERLMLDSYQRLRNAAAVRQRKLKMMELGLLSVNAGIVDAWEVTLLPNRPFGYPRSIVVTARDSFTAQQLALRKFPGWQLGAVRKLNN